MVDVIEEPARIRLELQSRPENVALVRAVVSGLAAATDLNEELTSDLKTAISEACNNVVIHAYDHIGPMLVEIEGLHDGINVTVTDSGSGITRVAGGQDRMGLGLALISALADRAEFVTPEAGGTEVRMWFARDTAIPETSGSSTVWSRETAAKLEGDVIAWFSPVALMRFVLGRVVRSVAASARFSVARVSELREVNDALAEYVELAADGQVGVALSSETRRVSLTGGPLWEARDPASNADPEDAGRLERRRQELAEIVDSLSMEPFDSAQLLHLELLDRSGAQR